MVVHIQLVLWWNTYLLISSDIVNFVWKTNEGKAESIVSEWEVVWLGQSHFFPAKVLAEGINMTHSGILYQLDISVLFSWTIDVSDFHPLEIYKNLDLRLSTITFTVNSHANKITTSINMFICFKYYTAWNQFYLLKYTLKFWQLKLQYTR